MRVLLTGITVLAICASTHSAWAQDGDAFADAMHHYFQGEKAGGVDFMVGGASLLSAGAVLRGADYSRALNAASYPMMSVGFLQLLVGIGLYARTDAQLAALKLELRADRHALIAAERERMARVMSGTFFWAQLVELVLMAGGVLAGVYGLADDLPLATGLGFGFASSAGFTLAFDMAAIQRAEGYLEALEVAAQVQRGAPGGGLRLSLSW